MTVDCADLIGISTEFRVLAPGVPDLRVCRILSAWIRSQPVLPFLRGLLEVLRMQRSSAASANGIAKDVIEFTLKPHSSKIRLSATHITARGNETQHSLCKRIADIAHLPLNRLRVTFEKSHRVVDKRFHPDTAPKVTDIANEDNILIIKDLGPFLSLLRSLHRLLFIRLLN